MSLSKRLNPLLIVTVVVIYGLLSGAGERISVIRGLRVFVSFLIPCVSDVCVIFFERLNPLMKVFCSCELRNTLIVVVWGDFF